MPHTLRQPAPFGCPGFRRAHGPSRRVLLQVGGLGAFGLGLPQLLASPAGPRPGPGRARSCILVFAWGGPSQLDTWDPKPDAPAEVRGEFRPVATSVPGVRVSEHFPRLARLAHRYALVRSLAHDDPAHLSSVHHVLTGHLAPRPKSDAAPPSRRDSPHAGAVLARLRPPAGGVPPFVTLPWVVSHPAAPGGVAPGQNGGWLGPGFDPLVLAGNLAAADFHVPGLARPSDVSAERLAGRRSLLQRAHAPAGDWQRAFALLTSPRAQRAFDLGREPPRVRDRYGRHVHGQCLLLARRLVEAGARLVQVNWHQDGRNFWDTHADNFNRLRRDLMPPADQGLSALLEDLGQRGLLDETLVVWVGEFGRNPRVTRGNAGREHWPFCYSAVLAGGGVRGGQVYGSSDRLAAYPARDPVSPADLTATLYHALGLPAETTLTDRLGRPSQLTQGRAVSALFG
jgi:Protein of unknown function (DUF1501)